MNWITQILILSIPFISEACIEAWFEKKRNISVNHPWSMVARGLLTLIISLIFDWYKISTWWQAFLFSGIIHFSFFNYFYNALTGRRWNYLRNEGIDKLLSGIPSIALVFYQAIILVSTAMIYFHLPVVLGFERPSWLY